MKSNLILRIRFYYTIFKTKATILMLHCRDICNREHKAKVKHFESILGGTKQLL